MYFKRHDNWLRNCIVRNAKRAICKVKNDMSTRTRVFVFVITLVKGTEKERERDMVPCQTKYSLIGQWTVTAIAELSFVAN